ncbi:MAG: hypothetical protein HRU40_21045 [Saprospiraceae bacterium]|nr:hypothetical protein [Saprospiraceae bacterium]
MSCLETDHVVKSSEILEQTIKNISENKIVGLTKIEASGIKSQMITDPILNLIFIFEKNQMIRVYPIPSIYEDDVKLLSVDDNMVTFEVYASTVGYTSLYLIEIPSLELLVSEKIMEAEDFKRKIDLKGRKVVVIDYEMNKIEKSLKKELFISCE